MPALYSMFKRLLETDPMCPMCEANVPPVSLILSSEPENEFKALTALMKDSGPDEDKKNEDGEDEDDDDGR